MLGLFSVLAHLVRSEVALVATDLRVVVLMLCYWTGYAERFCYLSIVENVELSPFCF